MKTPKQQLEKKIKKLFYNCEINNLVVFPSTSKIADVEIEDRIEWLKQKQGGIWESDEWHNIFRRKLLNELGGK